MADAEPPKQTIDFDTTKEYVDWLRANQMRLRILSTTKQRSLFHNSYSVTYRELRPGEPWAGPPSTRDKIILAIAIASILGLSLVIVLGGSSR